MPPTSRGATFPPPSSRGLILSLRGGERIRGVPVASQEEALSRGKARGTPGSCHHCQSPPDVSVHSREPGFPALPRLSSRGSTHTTVARGAALWESLVGKPLWKASWESLEGMPQIPFSTRRVALHCCYSSGGKCTCMPHSRRGLTPLGRLQNTPRSMSALERNPQVPAPTPHKILGAGIDRRGIPRGPRATRMGPGLSGGHQSGSLRSPS